MSNRVENEENQVKKRRQSINFEWSFRPMLVWMHFLGISLQMQVNNNGLAFSRLYNWLIKGFGIFLFCGNLSRLIIVMYSDWFSYDDNSRLAVLVKRSTSTVIWNSFIYWFNELFLSLGIQIAVMMSTAVNWKDLVATLHRMENNKMFKREHFQKFRRIFQYGFAFILLVFILMDSYSLI